MASPEERHLRLTLRTLLAYLDDTLAPAEAKQIGQKLAQNPGAQQLAERIKKVTHRRGLATPPPTTFGKNTTSDPNVVACYLSDTLPPNLLADFESTCLESDMHLAEVAACHQILTLVLCEQLRIPPTSYRRMYALVKGRESVPNREPGQGIPVGGAYPDVPVADPDESDGAYLLGLPVLTSSLSLGRKIVRWSIVGLALVGFAFAVWNVWPKQVTQIADNHAVAVLPTRSTKATTTKPTVTTIEPKKPPVEPVKPPTEPVKPPVEPMPPVKPPVEPMPPVEPVKPAPPVELVPDRVPVKAGEVPIGVLESPELGVTVTRAPDATPWNRIIGKDLQVRTGSRVVCLPGYKSKFKLDNGGIVELWGNLPDLLPLPVCETSVTFHVPYDGYAADLTIHTGRVYVSTTQPNGTKMRLRVLNEIWDLTLPDAKTEVVVEVVRRLVPGRLAETPETSIALHVMKGVAGLKVRYKDVPRIESGETVFWSNKGKGLEGPIRPQGPVGRGESYFSRVAVYPNEAQAKPALEALDEFNKRLVDKTRVRAMLAEGIREQLELTPRTLAEGRFSVLGYAAIGEFETLVDLLGDSTRHSLRQTSVSALRIALAVYNEKDDDFRILAMRKLGLNGEQADELTRLLRGASAEDRQTPEFIDGLIAGLSSPSLALREVSFAVLVLDIDPAAQKIQRLMQYNAAAPADIREPFVRAWTTRAVELKKPKEVVKESREVPLPK